MNMWGNNISLSFVHKHKDMLDQILDLILNFICLKLNTF